MDQLVSDPQGCAISIASAPPDLEALAFDREGCARSR
jgi:hypothetical protein